MSLAKLVAALVVLFVLMNHFNKFIVKVLNPARYEHKLALLNKRLERALRVYRP